MSRGFVRLLLSCFLGGVAACGARTGLPIPEPCPTASATATPAPLDVFILVDQSGSMNFVTASGKTKWASVRDALAAFLKAPASDGVGVAITFFPHVDPSVPASCATASDCGKGACQNPKLCMPDPSNTICSADSDCTMGGHCKTFNGLCLPNGGTPCETSADCTMGGDQCQVVGSCSDNSLCMPGTAPCMSGPCTGIGGCVAHTVCDASSYAMPAQSITPLPAGATPILAAFDARKPNGGTPTLPALTGAISAAKTWALANPTHAVIVILATDGLPTQCDSAITGSMSTPQGVTDVATVAGNGASEGIDTYVIGVFAPAEQATSEPSINQIAAAGGTKNAFVIHTSDDVTGKLNAALTTVREQASRCTFSIASSSGASIDLTRAHVSLKRADGSTTALERFASVSDCNASGYVPAGTGKIVLCPDTCSALSNLAGTSVDIELTCDQTPQP